MLSSPWWRTWDRATWLTRINHFRERLVSRFSSLCREKRKDNRLYNRCVTGTSATWDHFMWKLPPTRPDHTPFITEPSTQGGWCSQALRWWCVGLQNPVQRVLALLEPWEEVRRFKIHRVFGFRLLWNDPRFYPENSRHSEAFQAPLSLLVAARRSKVEGHWSSLRIAKESMYVFDKVLILLSMPMKLLLLSSF